MTRKIRLVADEIPLLQFQDAERHPGLVIPHRAVLPVEHHPLAEVVDPGLGDDMARTQAGVVVQAEQADRAGRDLQGVQRLGQHERVLAAGEPFALLDAIEYDVRIVEGLEAAPAVPPPVSHPSEQHLRRGQRAGLRPRQPGRQPGGPGGVQPGQPERQDGRGTWPADQRHRRQRGVVLDPGAQRRPVAHAPIQAGSAPGGQRRLRPRGGARGPGAACPGRLGRELGR